MSGPRPLVCSSNHKQRGWASSQVRYSVCFHVESRNRTTLAMRSMRSGAGLLRPLTLCSPSLALIHSSSCNSRLHALPTSGPYIDYAPSLLCYPAASHLISSHLISSHCISSHLISSHAILLHPAASSRQAPGAALPPGVPPGAQLHPLGHSGGRHHCQRHSARWVGGNMAPPHRKVGGCWQSALVPPVGRFYGAIMALPYNLQVGEEIAQLRNPTSPKRV